MFGAILSSTIIWMLIVAAALAAYWLLRKAQLRTRRQVYAMRLSGALSPRTIDKLVDAGGDKAVRPGVSKEIVTVLVGDRTEDGMAAFVECIHLSDGTLPAQSSQNHRAFWNFPSPQSNHAARACAAALRWRKRMSGIPGGRSTRMGVHTGAGQVEIAVGSDRADFSIAGPAIEIAEYLLRLNSCLGTAILISLKTKREIGEKFVTRKVGDFKMPRREKPLIVYELMAPKDEDLEGQAFRDEFANALQLFQTGDFYHSQLTFQRLADEYPQDEAIKFYLARLEEVLANPPDGIWDGIVDPKLA